MKAIKNITNTMYNITSKTHLYSVELKKKLTNIVCNNDGEGFIDTALKILISVVIGALLLAGLYMLFKDTLLPTLEQRIKDLFNFAG